jgi:hypothetical protein
VRTPAFTVALALTLCAGLATEARAQAGQAFLRPHAIELNLGGAWLAGVDFGSTGATLTRNQTVGATYTLFSTASTLGAALGAEGRVGYHLTRSISVEGAFLFARPSLETAISGDAEGAPGITARETISRFLVDVSGVLHLRSLRIGRAVPFVLGGAGYLRELHEGQLLAETGHTYHLGAGAKWPLVTRRGVIRALGIRLDGRLYFRTGGADLDAGTPTRTMATAGATLIVEL